MSVLMISLVSQSIVGRMLGSFTSVRGPISISPQESEKSDLKTWRITYNSELNGEG